MKVAFYHRVSTDDQRCERQHRDLTLWCDGHGHTVEIGRQDKASGADTTREGRADLMRRAKHREFEAIVVTELSRWSRSTVDLLETLEALAADGVRLIAINGPDFDIAKPLGKMMLTVLGAVSEFERSLIRERVKSGLDAKKARGERLGRAPGDAPQVRRVRSALAKAPSLRDLPERKLAETLKCSRNTLRKALDAERT